jgi:hypothetical protein
MGKGERARWELGIGGGARRDDGKERLAERQPISGQEHRPIHKQTCRAESSAFRGLPSTAGKADGLIREERLGLGRETGEEGMERIPRIEPI